LKKYLTPNVEIYLNSDRQDLLKALSTAKYNIVSSKVESFGIVALEASYYGVPTISFTKDDKLHGTKDIMGKYFSPTNGEDLQEKINTDYDLQYKMHLHSDVLSRFNEDVYLQKIEQLFKPKLDKNYLSY
jgi:glycosyltransferase involved in cell wall biosynthesis